MYSCNEAQIKLFKFLKKLKVETRFHWQAGWIIYIWFDTVKKTSLDTFCRLAEQDDFTLSRTPQKHKPYPSQLELKALKDLMSDETIIIKSADKGGAME